MRFGDAGVRLPQSRTSGTLAVSQTGQRDFSVGTPTATPTDTATAPPPPWRSSTLAAPTRRSLSTVSHELLSSKHKSSSLAAPGSLPLQASSSHVRWPGGRRGTGRTRAHAREVAYATTPFCAPPPRALLSATYGPAPSVAKAPASIRLEGPDAGVGPALLAALCRARVVSGNVLVGEGNRLRRLPRSSVGWGRHAVALRLNRQRAWGGEAAAPVLATQEFVANGGRRSWSAPPECCIAGGAGSRARVGRRAWFRSKRAVSAAVICSPRTAGSSPKGEAFNQLLDGR